jgi:hypothetical protein
MTPNLEITLATAEKRFDELVAEYDACLHSKSVSPAALQLTHDVCMHLRSALDRTARRYWDMRVSPSLTEKDRNDAKVYFPIAKDIANMDATLGRWRWKSVRDQHQPVYDYFLANQPFSSPSLSWLHITNELAVAGKHIDLLPQTRIEERRITVSTKGGQVSWGPGVTFGPGVSVMGAPVDPRTQRIVPTPGVTERIEVWVHFLLKDYNVNAAAVCKDACMGTRRIVSEFCQKFGLG